MDKKHFEIYSGDTLTAIWCDGRLDIINEALLPLYLSRIPNAEMWLETRAIDSHRANSRLLKKALRLAERDDVSTVMHVNGATITDNYWIREPGSLLTWEDIRFSDDYFASLALVGAYNSFIRAANSKRSRTPELTNTGSFEKCWRLRGGRWWMHKRANHEELFSELFVYRLGLALDMPMAVYERGDGCIKSLDFTEGTVNFEPASAFMGDNEEYPDVVQALEKLCPGAIEDYVKMIFLDTICANPDRHTNNFGLLRSRDTGALLGLAPNFDNNMALIAHGYPTSPKAGDLLIVLFQELLEAYPQYRTVIPPVTETMVRDVVDGLHMKVKKQVVVDLVMKRYRLCMGDM